MENNDKHSQTADRIGRYLDGEKVALNAQEQLLASEIDMNQRALANAMDQVRVPQAVLDRIGRKARLQVVSPFGRVLRVASLAAVAAAMIVTTMLLWNAFHQSSLEPGNVAVEPTPTPNVAQDSLNAVANEVASTDSDKMELIAAMTMDDDTMQVALEVSRPDTAIPATEGK